MQRLAVRLLPLTAALLLGACDKAPTAPADRPPAADSPAGAVRAIEWAFNHRRLDVIAGLLPADFRFQTAGVDSAGNPTRDSLGLGGREEFLAALRGLFEGTPTQPGAERVLLSFDRNLTEFPDTRPGKDPGVHRMIRTALDLKVALGDGSVVEVTGNALLYSVRGDSAAIPPELAARGLRPDPGRWWLDRWEDETLTGAGDRPLPAHALALGELLRRYLPVAAR